jgi:hypothetical protein
MEKSKKKRDSLNKPDNYDTVTDVETPRDLDKKQRTKTDAETAAETMQKSVYPYAKSRCYHSWLRNALPQ